MKKQTPKNLEIDYTAILVRVTGPVFAPKKLERPFSPSVQRVRFG